MISTSSQAPRSTHQTLSTSNAPSPTKLAAGAFAGMTPTPYAHSRCAISPTSRSSITLMQIPFYRFPSPTPSLHHPPTPRPPLHALPPYTHTPTPRHATCPPYPSRPHPSPPTSPHPSRPPTPRQPQEAEKNATALKGALKKIAAESTSSHADVSGECISRHLPPSPALSRLL